NRPRRRPQADAHVHRDAELRVMRPFERENLGSGLAGLMLKESDRGAGVVPEQMVDPAPRLALEIDVLAAEEKGLDDEMLKLELAGLDAVVHPLMRGIEAARMPGHGDEPRLALSLVDLLGVGERI